MALRDAPSVDLDHRDDAAWAVEELRRAEAHLARRRQSRCGPGDTDRAAMRCILEAADLGELLTPTDLAHRLRLETSSVSGLLRRLGAGGLVVVRPHPDDGRRKSIHPVDRNQDADAADPLSAAIRREADDLSPQEAELIVRFLRRVTDAVELECR